VNAVDHDNQTALHFAVGDPGVDIEVVELLLANGADVNTGALHFACANRVAPEVIALLLEKVADVNALDNQNMTALHYAASAPFDPWGGGEVVELLLADRRVDPNIPSVGGWTALHFAANNKNTAVLKALLSDDRTHRTRPTAGQNFIDLQLAQEHYDVALREVKRPHNARFRGLVRAIIVFRRMRLRAAQAAYAPGGAGFATAAASFQALQQQLA
jgi:ankyrin repeat protein